MLALTPRFSFFFINLPAENAPKPKGIYPLSIFAHKKFIF